MARATMSLVANEPSGVCSSVNENASGCGVDSPASFAVFGCLPCFNAALVQQDTAGPTDGF